MVGLFGFSLGFAIGVIMGVVAAVSFALRALKAKQKADAEERIARQKALLGVLAKQKKGRPAAAKPIEMPLPESEGGSN